ncbi:MAG: flagellar protein FlgN [Clostridium butyricum]|nr:flagellar protein FlgN [Clostridium butyricum]
MIDKLIQIMREQEKHLKQLSELLEIQKDFIIEKDVFGLEGVVDKLNECSKKIAKEEVARRNLLNNGSLKEFVFNSNNDELKATYMKISDTVIDVKNKKDTNDLLLKQQLIFTNKMLNIFNPTKEIKTYNSCGALKK